MDFEPCFKVYNLVSIRPKSMKLSQMTNLNVIFHMVGSVYRLVTIRNSPQFPVEFRNGLLRRVANIGVRAGGGGGGARGAAAHQATEITRIFGQNAHDSGNDT